MPTFIQLMPSNPAGFGQSGRALEGVATGLDQTRNGFSAAVKQAEQGWQGAARDAQSTAAQAVGNTLDMVSFAAVRAGATATRGGLQLAAQVTQLRTFCQTIIGAGFVVLPVGTVIPGPAHYSEAAAAGPAGPAVLAAYEAQAMTLTQSVNALVVAITEQDLAVAAEIQGLQADLASGRSTSRTPNTDRTLASPPPVDRHGQQIPQAIWDRIQQGNAFDETREPYYTARGGANEVQVDGGRLDSYVPGREIVSRKNTQLADVQESTALEYVRELERKYSPGTQIQPTASNEAQIPGLGGSTLRGSMILEVPPQARPVPRAVIDAAAARGITIRDTLGNVYR